METKELTCRAIMIGDWVMAKKEPIRIATPFGNETVLHQLTLYGYTSDGAKAGPFLETELTPIPLTAEILEKNGFKNIDTGLDCDGSNIYWKHNNGYSINTQDINLNFVHELQHALRLCGINDKEIVL